MTVPLLDDVQLAKLTIVAFRDQKFSQPVRTWRALFNPTELKFGRRTRWNREQAPGASGPTTSFGNGEPAEVSIELFFDGTGVVLSTETVTARVEGLLAFLELHGETHQPYYAHLYWGAFTFRGVMKSADVTYTLFDRAGLPLRAKVTAVFTEVVDPEHRAAQDRLSSPDLRQTWVVRDGDRIDGIADQVYGSPVHWRGIAGANGLVNPRRLEPGAVLVLPPKASP